MYMGNVALVIMNIAAIPFFVWIVKKATPLIVPLVVSLTVAGGYSVTNSLSDVWIVFAAGVVGYILVKLGYPLVSILLGVVLGGLAETNFRQALRISDGSLMTFIEKPISAAMLAIGVLILLRPVLTAYLRKKMVAKRT
jgi:putative tricarboxylic transport membrane protein